MANYFDISHIEGKQLTPQQIADAIRHKKFGVDVREAMAQGLEYCMTQAQEVTDIKESIGAINKQIDKLNAAVFGDGAVPIDTPIDSDNQTNKAQEVHLD